MKWFKQIQKIQQNQQKRMQICGSLSPQYPHTHHQLQKIASTPTLQPFGCSQPQQTDYVVYIQDGYWRAAVKAILRFKKFAKISKDSIFLAITYLRRLVMDYSCQLNENNYQKISMTLVLMATKMNEIYPPKLSILTSRCSKFVTPDELIQAEADILKTFNYDLSCSETAFSLLYRVMQRQSKDKRQDGEKLLGLALTEKNIANHQQENIISAIIYLIKPSMLRQIGFYEDLHSIKGIASQIYNLYIANKSK